MPSSLFGNEEAAVELRPKTLIESKAQGHVELPEPV